jgi:3-oxoacyl-(acyl-carrier-protein) synthase
LPQTISITAIASISPLGNDPKTIWENYKNNNHCFTSHFLDHKNTLVAKLDDDSNSIMEALKQSDIKYKSLDKTVLYAMAASRKAIQNAGWNANDVFGINIGSSRGATDLFEKHHQEYLETGKAQTLASPTTTLGNISSWVAHDLQSSGPEISHSITCSTALHALLNGVAWLRSGMADKFLVGGSEAPLTDFTVAQMRALKIYANLDKLDIELDALRQAQHDNPSYQPEIDALRQTQHDNPICQSEPVEDLLAKNNYPCRALDLEKTQNTLILGEGAGVCCLEIGKKENALAFIEGIGYATEILEHNISISAEATCFQKSMQMALKNTNLSEVDVIVMHAPGTKAGDLTEYKAIQKVFNSHFPMLTTNKWKIGHTFGASGMLSIEMGILMLQHQEFIGVPFAQVQNPRKKIRKVLINAVGFGGNAVSVLLSL